MTEPMEDNTALLVENGRKQYLVHKRLEILNRQKSELERMLYLTRDLLNDSHMELRDLQQECDKLSSQQENNEQK